MTLIESIIARSQGQRRIMALSLLVGALTAIWFLVVEPVTWLLVSQAEWRNATRRELALARGRADVEPELRKRVADLTDAPVWSRFYDLPVGQDAGALVQRDVVGIGSASGVAIQALVTLPKAEEAGLTGYGVRFTAAMTADQLRKFIDALRTNARYLRVERLRVAAPEGQRTDNNASLAVTMEVLGYVRPRDKGGPSQIAGVPGGVS